MNNDGTFNCIIKINDKEYNNNLKCKTKKEAKNGIAEFVYKSLISSDQKYIKIKIYIFNKIFQNVLIKIIYIRNNIFNEKVTKLLTYNNIQTVDLFVDTMECEQNKYICIIEFPNIKNHANNKAFLAIEPKTKEELNENIFKFLKEELDLICKDNNTDNEGKMNIYYINKIFENI